MRFLTPIHALVLLPFALAAAWALWRRRPRGVAASDGLGALPRTWRVRLQPLPLWMSWLALLALLVAMARPQTGLSELLVDAEGVATVVCLDLSSSMSRQDMARGQDRLTVAKAVIEDLLLPGGSLPGRPDDAIGLVSFARYADARCGLTLDHEVVVRIMQSLEMAPRGSAEDGTAIGDALARSLERLKDVEAVSKIVILVTDGEQRDGVADPLEVAGLAAGLGIKLYPIAVGRGPGVQLLRALAEKTGGRAYLARDKDQLVAVVQEIDRLETSVVDRRELTRWPDAFAPLVWGAFLCLVLAFGLENTVLRTAP